MFHSRCHTRYDRLLYLHSTSVHVCQCAGKLVYDACFYSAVCAAVDDTKREMRKCERICGHTNTITPHVYRVVEYMNKVRMEMRDWQTKYQTSIPRPYGDMAYVDMFLYYCITCMCMCVYVTASLSKQYYKHTRRQNSKSPQRNFRTHNHADVKT